MSSTATPSIDSKTFRRVLGHYPTGVCAITAVAADGVSLGLVVGSFTSASLDPPLIAFFPDKRSARWPRIANAGRFCVNVLSADQEDLCRLLAATQGGALDGLSHRPSPNGSPILDGAVAWMDCSLHAVHEAGDHYLALGRVDELEAQAPSGPLLFYRGEYGAFAVRPDGGGAQARS